MNDRGYINNVVCDNMICTDYEVLVTRYLVVQESVQVEIDCIGCDFNHQTLFKHLLRGCFKSRLGSKKAPSVITLVRTKFEQVLKLKS